MTNLFFMDILPIRQGVNIFIIVSLLHLDEKYSLSATKLLKSFHLI